MSSEPENPPKKEYVNLTEDGGVKKRILQEGDIVTIRRRSEDIGKVRIPGVKYFAFPKGYNNQNPDGYIIDTSGRMVDKPQ